MKYINNKIVFESGDWVVLIANTSHSINDIGEVGKITEVWETGCRVKVSNREDIANSCKNEDLRLATQEEIDAATKEEKII